MRVYQIDIVTAYQIIVLNEGASILGLRRTETSDKKSLPQLIVQDPTPTTSRVDPNLSKIPRNLYSVYLGKEDTDTISNRSGDRIFSFNLAGRFSSSQFRFIDFFRYKTRDHTINHWGVYLELLPNEVSAVSASPVSDPTGLIQNYAEGSLLRAIT